MFFITFAWKRINLREFYILAIIEVDKAKFEATKKGQSDIYSEGRPIYINGFELIKFWK